MFNLANPYWLFGLLCLPFLIWWHRRKKPATMIFTSLETISFHRSLKIKLNNILPYFDVFVIGLTLIGLARPQLGRTYEEIITEGIDIMLVLDISSSMKAIGFPENHSIEQVENAVRSGKLPSDRITAARNAARDFIKGRKNDRIGLVIFSRDAFTQCPLTVDYTILLQLLERVDIGLIEDGTAIGMGIATALNRLRESEAKSKVMILLTDGINNAGRIDPLTAAELAKSLGVKIYTIGVGTIGITLYPVQTAFGMQYARVEGDEVDEVQLQQIADATGGLYFRADTPGALKQVYNTIDKLEKIEIKSIKHTLYREIFKYFVMIGFIVLIGQLVLRYTYISRIP